MDREGLQFFHSVIWDKVNPGLGWKFRRQHEMIMFAHKAGQKLLWSDPDRAVPNLYSCFPPKNRQHPNEKPLELATYFTGLVAKPGQTLFDPCGGSGTIPRACKDLGIKCVMAELDEQYCEIAAKKMSQEAFNFT